MYSEHIMSIFAEPKNVGILQGASGVGQFTDEKTSDTFKLYLKIENNYIVDASFKAFVGVCGVAIFSVLTEMLKNKSIEDALKIEEKELAAAIGELDDNRKYLIVDAVDTLKIAISDYRKKLEKMEKNA